jgi:tetratricopeptide (TPR) repeat protein
LETEVEASAQFAPPIHEFILVTTAPDDATIQREARLLEERVRAAGRDLSIAVWGWGRLQQEIVRFSEAIREFMPDGSPFADQQLHATEEVRKLVETAAQTGQQHTALLRVILERLPSTIAAEASTLGDVLERHLNDEIDRYRDLARNKQPRTAIQLLTALKQRAWDTASPRIRFRILSNLGAAHYFLGKFEDAADLLLQAAAFDPGDAKGMANRVAALLLKNRKNEAHQAAVEALARYPDDPDIASQRLLAIGPSETVDGVWNSLPGPSRHTAAANINRIVALREQNDAHWCDAAEEAIEVHPNDAQLKALWAESILDRTLRDDPGAVGRATAIGPTQAQLAEAADVLVAGWQATLNQETPPMPSLGHNAALAKTLVGEIDAAIKIVDAVVATGYDTEEFKELRISLYRRTKRSDEGIAVADTLTDSPYSRIVRADLRLDRSPSEARTILADRASFTDEREIVAAALIVIDTYCKERNFADALAEAERLKLVLPDHPQGRLSVYHVKRQSGDVEADAALDAAVKLVTPETDFPTRFFVCDALSTAGKDDSVLNLLESHASRYLDSPALRMLVAAAANADRRVTLNSILTELPPEVAAGRFYRKAKIALALRIGELADAERQIRQFLEVYPKDLEMQLRLMTVLFNQNQKKALAEEAAKPANEFSGAPELFIRLAQIKNEFGDSKEAYNLAYKLLLSNPSNQTVNLGYVGMFLPDKVPQQRFDLSPSKVDTGMAVGVLRHDSQLTVYIIEPDPSLRPGPTYLPPEHGLAQRFLGRAVGDVIELPDHSSATIAWMRHKEIHSLNDVLEEFNNRFPDAEGLEKVRIDHSSPDSLGPMLERVRMRHEAVQRVAEQYDNGALPLALMARQVGTDPVSAFIGLINSGHTIRVCEGTKFEREEALKTINDNKAKGCVVDALTLYLIRRLNLEAAVEKICGPIGIVGRTASRIQEEIHRLEDGIDKPSMSIVYRDGQYYREETTPERKKEVLAVMQADQQWLAQHAQVIPAKGAKDPSADWVNVEKLLDSDFLDEIRAAGGSGRMLVVEDHALRTLAFREFSVRGAWLQPVLMQGLGAKVITNDEYLRAMLALIDAKEEFISINAAVLYTCLHGISGYELPADFRKLTSRLGGLKMDGSHISVAFEAVAWTWDDHSLSATVQQAMLGNLLERLTMGRTLGEIEAIITGAVTFARRRDDESMERYVRDWGRWHFLQVR